MVAAWMFKCGLHWNGVVLQACSTVRLCYVSYRKWCCFAILTWTLLQLAGFEDVEEMDVVCQDADNKLAPVEFHVKTETDKKDIGKKCFGRNQIYLKNQKQYFTSEGLRRDEFDFLLNMPYVKMCIEISYTDWLVINLPTRSIEGGCEDAVLRITNNENLTFIKFDLLSVTQFDKPTTVSVRGNPQIYSTALDEIVKKFGKENADVQPLGECGLPKPFKGFDRLKKCSDVYGRLVLDGPQSPTTFPADGLRGFSYTGCIQIKNTNLEDYSFLEHFKKFKRIPGCDQYITGNKKLCIRNFDLFTKYIIGVKIYDNQKGCDDECVGEEVTEEYLRRIEKCRIVHGNLVIKSWYYTKPKNVKVLRNIDSITGKLFIIDTTGISEINEFSSLKSVGDKDSSDVVIIVRNNSHLASLEMPNLVGITISKADPRCNLKNNPKLRTSSDIIAPTDGTSAVTDEIGNVTGVRTPWPFQQHQDQKLDPRAKSKKGFWGGVLKRWYIIVAFAVILAIILLILLLILLLAVRKKRSSLTKSISLTKLDSNSSLALKGLCRDVLSLDPFVWCAKERDLLWSNSSTSTRSEFERQPAGADEPASTSPAAAPVASTPTAATIDEKDEEFLKRRMIPIASNAAIPLKKETDYNKPLLFRSQQLFPFELCVIISSTDDINDSMPRLPKKIGKMELYSDAKINTSVTYKLTRTKRLSEALKLFFYEIRNLRMRVKRNMKALFYYRAADQRFPKDFAESLEIFGFVHKRNAIVLSTRYKELYSLLHLIFVAIYQLKKPVPLKELFRIHTQNCNGAPVDRFEMLYALRFILEWATITSCVPPDTVDDPEQWAQIYDEIAKFSESHPNIANVHPRHVFGKIDELEERMKNAENTPGRRFAERPPAPMCDPFRPMTPEEIKQKMNQIVDFGEGGDDDFQQDAAAKDDFWKQKAGKPGGPPSLKTGLPAPVTRPPPQKEFLPRRRESRDKQQTKAESNEAAKKAAFQVQAKPVQPTSPMSPLAPMRSEYAGEAAASGLNHPRTPVVTK